MFSFLFFLPLSAFCFFLVEGVFSPFLLFVFFNKFPPRAGELWSTVPFSIADKVVKPDDSNRVEYVEFNTVNEVCHTLYG